ncbi:hypothetical protein [Mesonia maritima]|uniref:Flagellar protein FliL n=1 Tax=Mesonia maritima TaxID=1793873 RepID=A0ABU1K4S9_9FLAO|nr:hypothetical protein [Mesonia maritima]MDR6300620.1 hypothetical protein [Mesonia maritima]
MKKIISLFIILLFLNCKTKNESGGEFVSAMEIKALNIKDNLIYFNVSYTVEFKQNTNQDCMVESKDELNSMIIEPTIRSVVRSLTSQLDYNEIEKINKIEVKKRINRLLSKSKTLKKCPLKISIFTITRKK